LRRRQHPRRLKMLLATVLLIVSVGMLWKLP
jgi:hypothetical protein